MEFLQSFYLKFLQIILKLFIKIWLMQHNSFSTIEPPEQFFIFN